jgi:hypothetical protein
MQIETNVYVLGGQIGVGHGDGDDPIGQIGVLELCMV